jgi:hypothetical protein
MPVRISVATTLPSIAKAERVNVAPLCGGSLSCERQSSKLRSAALLPPTRLP